MPNCLLGWMVFDSVRVRFNVPTQVKSSGNSEMSAGAAAANAPAANTTNNAPKTKCRLRTIYIASRPLTMDGLDGNTHIPPLPRPEADHLILGIHCITRTSREEDQSRTVADSPPRQETR